MPNDGARHDHGDGGDDQVLNLEKKKEKKKKPYGDQGKCIA